MNSTRAFRRAARRVSSSIGVLAAAAGMGTATVGLVVPANPAAAATTCTSVASFTWTGTGSALGNNKWSDASNWQGLAAPASGACVNLTFPSSATATGVTTNDLTNLEIASLSIAGPYTLNGQTVFMGDSGAGATVTDTANAAIGLTQNLRNNTVYNVSSGSKLTVTGAVLDVSPFPTTALTSSGAGTLDLAPASLSPNTYTGNTVVSAGTLQLSDPSALGAAGNTVTVQSGGTLELTSASGAFSLPQAVALAGGTVLGTDTNDQLDGAVTMSSGGILSAQTAKNLTVTKAITGTGPLTVNSGTAGTVTLGGTANNTYTGGATVAGGTLDLDVVPSSATGIATPGALTENNGSAVTLAAPGQLDPSGSLTLVGASVLDLAGNAAGVSNLVLNSTSSTGAPTVKNTGTSAASLTVGSGVNSEGTGLPSVISAGLQAPQTGPLTVQTSNSLLVSGPVSGGPISLTAGSTSDCTSGTSTARCVALVLSGSSPGYTGLVSANAGVLDVTGDLSGAPVTLGGGTLTGTGTVGALTVNSGTLAPGTTVATPASHNFTDADSPGVLTASTLTMTGGTLAERLDGASPGNGATTCSGYDQVHVTGGSVNLGSSVATLSAVVDKNASNAPCFIPANNQPYTIISNAASGATETGNFKGLAQGGTVTDPNFNYGYTITYQGGTPPASVVLTSSVTTNMSVTSSAVGAITYGQQVAFRATVSQKTGTTAPTGSVAFTDNNNGQAVTLVCTETGSNVVTLSGNIATCTPKQALPGGAQTITATYSGDSHYPGNSASVSQTVNPQNTTTTLSGGAPNNPSTYGQKVTFKATVAGTPGAGAQATTALPTGTVTFLANGNALPDCTNVAVTTVSPVTATCNTTMLAAGNNSMTATYSGDGNYTTSTSTQSVTQTVNKATTTTTVAGSDSNPNPSAYGQPVTFTATITPTTQGAAPPSGTVQFLANGTALPDCSAVPVTNSSNTVTCTTADLPVSPGGTDTVSAAYSGDSNYAGSTTAADASQAVNQASTTTGVVSSANPAAVGQHVTYTATVTPQYTGPSAPGGTVQFSVDGQAIPGCGAQAVSTSSGQTTATCAVLYTSAGQHSIGAAYSGDGNYTPSSTSDATSPTGPVSQNVVAASSSTQLTSSPNPSLAQQPVTFVTTVTPQYPGGSAPTGTVTLKVNGTALTGCSSVPVSTTNGTTTATCTTTALPAPANDPQQTDAVTAFYSGDSNYSSSNGVLFQTVRLDASQLGAEPRIAAFQANGGALWSVGSAGWTNWGVGMAPGTSPAVLSLPNGGYEIAFQANGGNLWTVGTAGWTNWGVGMAPGTSPAVLSLPNGGYEIAFQAQGGALWSVGTAGWTNWGVGMAPGTSPAMYSLPGGGYEIAFQANGGNLWTVGTAQWANWGVGMASGTSPAVTSLPGGGYEIAFQANGGALWTVGTAGWTNWGVGMESGTSPALTSLPGGGFEIAFQAKGGNLWTIGAAGWTNWGLGMAPATSPSIVVGPSGGLIEGIQGFNGDLVTVGSQDYDWQLGLAANTSPGMI